MPNMTLVRTIRLLTCGAGRRARLAGALPERRDPIGTISKLEAFLSAVNRHARRQLLLSPHCAATLSQDEAALLGLICARQRRESDEFDARARWLVHEDGLADVRWHTDDLAVYLALDGIFLQPLAIAPVPTRQPVLPVLEPVTLRPAAMT